MIAKVLRGQRATGLLQYLFGPGERNEHRDPRVIAAWDGREHATDHRRLGALLDSTWQAARMSPEDRPVYHVSVALARAVPEEGLAADPHISDGQFAEVCGELVRAAGLESCRWVGVRHDSPGESHAHVVVTLASESGRRIHPARGDFYKLGQVCRGFEDRWDLRRTAPRDRTGPKYATRGEQEKTQRKGWPSSTRRVLQEQVRAVAGESESVEGFLRRLRDEGLLVRERLSPRDGSVSGYAVAFDRAAKDGSVDRVWFSGGKLASDLTLPKLRARYAWTGVEPRPQLLVDRGVMWGRAVDAARNAAAAVASGDRDAAWAASDFVASASRVVGGRAGRVLRESAAGFERAGYEPFGKVGPRSEAGAGLREAGRLLAVARFIPDEDAQRLLLLLAQLRALADATARLREAQDREVQAAAARRSAELLAAASARQDGADERLRPRRDRAVSREGITL